MNETTPADVTKKLSARIANPHLLLPASVQGILAVNKAVEESGLSAKTRGLVHMRVSQINGCAMCIDLHLRQFQRDPHGETLERLFAVAAWREAPFFTDAERAALDLAEHVTRIADRPDAVPDDVWNEAARHYDEKTLIALVTHIAIVNVFNRMNVATRQIPGTLKW